MTIPQLFWYFMYAFTLDVCTPSPLNKPQKMVGGARCTNVCAFIVFYVVLKLSCDDSSIVLVFYVCIYSGFVHPIPFKQATEDGGGCQVHKCLCIYCILCSAEVVM